MKDFFKNISIYGILPVLGKFLGFFLVPVYARIFTTEAFGQIELIVTLVSFLMYLVNLEFYSAIGRYFYEKKDLEKQAVLISTGLLMTLGAAVVVLLLCVFLEPVILMHYLDGADLKYELRIGFIWLFISAFSTYLGVIPRYDKRPKLYVLVNSVSLLFRLLSTILFVLVLKCGIVGVLYGHICGASLSLILNALVSRKFLVFRCSGEDAKLIFKYSLPIVPGLIVVGMWNPLFKGMMSLYFSVSAVGLYSFAARITSVATMFNGALRNAWRPMLFENISNREFISETHKISGKVSFVILSIGTVLSLLSPEFCLIIGTEEYVESALLIPFMVFAGYCQINVQLRGFGPLINNKTYITSVVSIVSMLIALGLFKVIGNAMGLLGIGIVLAVYDICQYLALYTITKKELKRGLVHKMEYIMLLFLFVSVMSLVYHMVLPYRIVFIFIYFICALLLDRKYHHIIVRSWVKK